MEIPPVLTAREREVLPFLISGATRNEIASHFKISPETVKLHTRNILEKFDAATVREGFARMNQYQTYFGNGGFGFSRYITEHNYVFEVLSTRVDAKCYMVERQNIVQGELGAFKKGFFLHKGTFDLDYKTDVLQVIELEPEGQKRNFEFVPLKPLTAGESFMIEEFVNIFDHFEYSGGSIDGTWSVPNSEKNMTFIFPPDDVPDDIQCYVSIGLEKVDHPGWTLEKIPNGIKVKIFEHVGTTRLNVIWNWTVK